LFSISLKSYHWIQHVFEAILAAGGNMNTRIASLTLATLIAATTARAEPARPFEGDDMNTISASLRLALEARAAEVVAFWTHAGPALWFAKDAEFDRRFRERYLSDHEAAARGELMHWQSTPEGALALVILLDQFPRNAFRDTPRMYDTDAMARKVASTAFAAGYDQLISLELRKFLVLPFAHSEDLADQERAVALARRLGTDDLAHAQHHRDIVRRFGRFPHRNRILGRQSTPEEQQYLDNGGYKG
jgi:uncharacterized protein (DUF924 family)